MGWIDVIVELPEAIKIWFARNDDDWFDRLSHRYTVLQLIVFAIFVSAESYIDQPINCWVPAHFHDSWEKFTNSYCWVRNTYYLPFEEDIPREHGEREKHPIKYYQWVPLILLAQAFMFYMPILLWRSLSSRTGIDVNTIVETSEVFNQEQDNDRRTVLLNFLVRLTDRYLGYSKMRHRGNMMENLRECTLGFKSCIGRFCCCCCGKRLGNYMVVLYVVVKLLFLANALGQLFILNAFLGHDYNLYGIHAIQSLIEGKELGESKRFPRVTLCDLDIRRLGNVNRYSVQCVLSINLFNEMIYLWVWFWLVLVTTLTFIGLLLWIGRIWISADRSLYIKRHLSPHPDFNFDSDNFNTEEFRMFVERYLRQDGIFVMRLVDLNTNKMTVTEILFALWEFYRAKPRPAIQPTTDIDTMPMNSNDMEMV